ncbi:lysine--tRNA ligase [Patescibacteria group bacterium]|nr:lysine--tRNA ligase [Patescibacteria group bacterium]
MFWLDRIYGQIEKAIPEKLKSGETLLVRDEKTPSGRVHIGNMRSLAFHAAMWERLREAGIPADFKFEINDFDPMDGLPVYLDEAEYRQHMGKPLYNIPSPEPDVAPNFAEYYAKEYIDAIHDAGFTPVFYRSSELYLAGKMNDAIRISLEKADVIRKIYKEISGADRPSDWHALSVVCENCGKIGTTKVSAFDGEKVTYACYPTAVKWAEGCGHKGQVSPFNGNAKLPWKVEWAAKWFVNGVDVEGGGKDHYSKGGARDVARHISEEVFGYKEPFGMQNEYFLYGGEKMSSSKGKGSSSRDVVNLVPQHIFRLALYGKDINQQINFDPNGDMIPVLFDQYDKIAEKYWAGITDDDTRLFLYTHTPEKRAHIEKRFLPRFSQVAFLVQMPHLNFETEIERLKGGSLTDADKKEAQERAHYAKHWLKVAADEEFVFTLAEDAVPEAVKALSDDQKNALKEVLAYVEANPVLEGQALHTELHEIRKRLNIDAKAFFGAIYLSFLGKDHGPKVGWFLSVLDRNFLISRLKETTV